MPILKISKVLLLGLKEIGTEEQKTPCTVRQQQRKLAYLLLAV